MPDKVVVITGGSSGIGRAAALAFAAEGTRVAIGARRSAEGEETARLVHEQGGDALFVQTDVPFRSGRSAGAKCRGSLGTARLRFQQCRH